MRSKYLWPKLNLAAAASMSAGRTAALCRADPFPMDMKIESKHTTGSCGNGCGARQLEREIGGRVGENKGVGGRTGYVNYVPGNEFLAVSLARN